MTCTAVDWSSAAGSSYTTARNNVNSIAKSVADFINWMKLDEGSKKLHIVGFDMGGLSCVGWTCELLVKLSLFTYSSYRWNCRKEHFERKNR